VDAPGFSSRDNVGEALHLPGLSQFPSHDIRGAARPYRESHASSDEALQRFVDRSVAA